MERPLSSPSSQRVLRVSLAEQAFKLGVGLGSALQGACLRERLVSLDSRCGSTFDAKREASIKIEDMVCMWNLSSNKVGCVNRDLHSSVGIRR